ncbi:ABC transporter ATP-binding protein [Cohnella zeiphila]|uniref:ABC transporter ATP-binding protein n=1 Tax=Cohnella zeiphila TaxID=2761120 RepID=A0A7X0VVP3_9BACL|nr:ABC transporter ATP-binding protein [Cohnella zeiphila]MBB6732186.1 ABC transporter ATP-binding protein [Cohnella zeiphila]
MLSVEGLTKRFPGGKGIEDVTFAVRRGEVFGFLGPNGAGKSTTIRHIMGFMKPDRGKVTLLGFDTWKEGAFRKRVGYLPGEIAFLEGMNGIGFLEFLARMQGVDSSAKRARLIERLQFDARTPIRKMSKGMKQKVGIVAAFMHDPELIVLDEPTSGLDPLMQRTFIELVLEEKARGTTFLMSSHSFPEIERTCDRAAIIKDGRIVAVRDIGELQSMQRKRIDLTFERPEDADRFARSEGLQVEARDGNRVSVSVSGSMSELIRAAASCSALSLDPAAQSLEDVFMHFYDRKGEIR